MTIDGVTIKRGKRREEGKGGREGGVWWEGRMASVSNIEILFSSFSAEFLRAPPVLSRGRKAAGDEMVCGCGCGRCECVCGCVCVGVD